MREKLGGIEGNLPKSDKIFTSNIQGCNFSFFYTLFGRLECIGHAPLLMLPIFDF
jgi:hypothetical protein